MQAPCEVQSHTTAHPIPAVSIVPHGLQSTGAATCCICAYGGPLSGIRVPATILVPMPRCGACASSKSWRNSAASLVDQPEGDASACVSVPISALVFHCTQSICMHLHVLPRVLEETAVWGSDSGSLSRPCARSHRQVQSMNSHACPRCAAQRMTSAVASPGPISK